MLNKKSLTFLVLGVLGAGSVGGCISGVGEQSNTISERSTARVASTTGTVLGFSMHYPERSRSEVVRRAKILSEMVAGRELSTVRLEALLDAGLDPHSPLVLPFDEAPDLALEYHASVDELKVYRIRAGSSDSSSPDIGDGEARERMSDYFARLASAQLVVAEEYELAHPHIGHDRSGEGRRGQGATTSRVESYLFTVRRQINGIPVLNAGVRFSIDRTGRLDGIRLGGVVVESVRDDSGEQPSGAGTSRARVVSDQAIHERFVAEQPPGVEVLPIAEETLYVMPEGIRRAVVEPIRVIRFSGRSPSAEAPLISRQQILGYSLTDVSADPRPISGTVRSAPLTSPGDRRSS